MGKSEIHPLANIDLDIRGVKCFSGTGSGQFYFSPITVIVGRNNSGKSTIIDAVESLTVDRGAQLFDGNLLRQDTSASLRVWTEFDRESINRHFLQIVSSGKAVQNDDYLKLFINRKLAFRIENGPAFYSESEINDLLWLNEQAQAALADLFRVYRFQSLRGLRVFRVAAERDVRPEGLSASLELGRSGQGLTNLVRAFLHEDRFDMSVVEEDLLQDLNRIYEGDSVFHSILCRMQSNTQTWEIHLRERGKGDIRLSQSGSSLKTIFLILCFIHLAPIADRSNSLNNSVLAIEEPENNLHPALLRRLLDYLASKRTELGASLVLTTHSSVCIDWASRRHDSTVIHVKNSQTGAVCRNVLDHFSSTAILDDLDIRGSDLLQSNGIIWVEGPSDRVYIRKWIDMASQGSLKEGVHYSFLYYGGKVLNHFDGANPQELTDRISMLSVNRNGAIVMDSDRQKGKGKRKPRMRLGETKRRMIEEIERVKGFSWVTQGREIENYVPDAVWREVISSKARHGKSGANLKFATIDIFENIAERPELSGFLKNKVVLAHAACEFLTDVHLVYLDLEEKLSELCDRIRQWNGVASSL